MVTSMPRATLITLLWIVVLFNMAFADILSFISPGFLAEVATGVIDGIVITPAFLLLAAAFIEVAVLMIVLTSLLPRASARIANVAAAGITILFVIGGGSLAPHYLLLAGVEVAALLAIVTLAWTWRDEVAA